MPQRVPPAQAGRSAKRQLFLLPGGIERHLKIKTCSVSRSGARGSVQPGLAAVGTPSRGGCTPRLSPSWGT